MGFSGHFDPGFSKQSGGLSLTGGGPVMTPAGYLSLCLCAYCQDQGVCTHTDWVSDAFSARTPDMPLLCTDLSAASRMLSGNIGIVTRLPASIEMN